MNGRFRSLVLGVGAALCLSVLVAGCGGGGGGAGAAPGPGVSPTDSDGDGVANTVDAFPTSAVAAVDTDGDGKPDAFLPGATPDQIAASGLTLDEDDDNDGVSDATDAKPLDPATFASFSEPVELGPLPGGTFCSAVAINDAGEIVGLSEQITGETSGEASAVRAVLWRLPAASRTELVPLPAGAFAAAYGLNNDGQIVGESENGSGGYEAVLWKDGASAPVALPSLAGGWGAAYAVNAAGEIVGESEDPASQGHAVLWTIDAAGLVITGPADLGVLPGGQTSSAYGVSDTGFAVGEADGPSGARAVAWVLGEGSVTGPVDLGALPGHVASAAYAVADDGTVVGESEGADGGLYAVYWQVTPAGGVSGPFDLGEAGTDSSASAVNASGRIAGWKAAAGGPAVATVWDTHTGHAGASEPLFADLVSQALGIDGRGRVVGAKAATLGDRGFVAVPLLP